jgi:hypothetical protein
LNTEEHLIETIQSIVDVFKIYVDAGIMPSVFDPCIAGNDLLEDYELTDIEAFIQKLSEHLEIIRQDGRSNETWRRILGNEFPKGEPESSTTRRYTYNNTEQFIEDMFPVRKKYNLLIDCKVTQDGWRPFTLRQFLASGRGFLRHNKKLNFFIKSCNAPEHCSVYWKVRNVGEVAESRDCIRGQIIRTDREHQFEHTNFYGPHFVECYIVENGICIARDRIDVPIDRY